MLCFLAKTIAALLGKMFVSKYPHFHKVLVLSQSCFSLVLNQFYLSNFPIAIVKLSIWTIEIFLYHLFKKSFLHHFISFNKVSYFEELENTIGQ